LSLHICHIGRDDGDLHASAKSRYEWIASTTAPRRARSDADRCGRRGWFNSCVTDEREPYPVTTVWSRYGGAYEPGKWVAFPMYPDQLPPDWHADDVVCAEFFRERRQDIGGGDSPQEAYDDLVRRRAER